MNKALDLLEIQRQALNTTDTMALGFVIVNQTLKLLPYQQAIFWTGYGASLNFESVSGNTALDDKGPYGLWLKGIINQHINHDENPVSILPKNYMDEAKNSTAKHAIILFLYHPGGEIAGGVWLERDTPFKNAEKSLLQELQSVWQTRLCLLKPVNKGILSSFKPFRKKQKYLWLAIALFALFPVRLNITAPAEIVAKEKMVASVPYDGILQDIFVDPGEAVTEGQALAEMEAEELKANMQAAERALKTTRSNLARLKREALELPEKKAEINILKAEIETREIEYEYAQTMLERSIIESPRAGISIFSDTNEFIGKPLRTGEIIMEIAAAGEKEILVRIPVDALIDFDRNSDIFFYPNVSPLGKIGAQIKSIGYQASADPDGLYTYKLRASLKNNEPALRIGWKGTAKIYGQWTILSYAVFRRPLMTLKRLGLW